MARAKALSVLMAVLLAACGGLIQGFDTGGISNGSAGIVREFKLPTNLQGVVTSAVLVGAMIGAIVGGGLADKLGRRTVLIACGAVFSAGVALEFTSVALPMLLAGRVVAGLAIGIASCVSTLYISEISPPALRGGYLSFFQLAVTVGIVCGIIIALVAGQHAGTWRILLGAGMVPGMLLFFGMMAMPESPAWLHHVGKEDAARAALARLRAADEVENEFAALTASTATAKTNKGASSGFSSPALQLALVAGVGMALIQQVTGINAVMYYAPTIFKAAGFATARDAIIDDLSLASLLVLVTYLASRLVDKLGRRKLLLWGIGGMVVALLILGAAFAQLGRYPFVPWVILGGLLLYIAAFALGPGPCIWLVIAEIYPLEVRGPAMSIATLASWLANLFVSSTFPAFSQGVGESNAFYIFSLISLLSWLFTWALLPETSGRTLDQIQEIWRERAAVLFKHHKTTPTS